MHIRPSTQNVHSRPMRIQFTSRQTTSRGGFDLVWPFELGSRVSMWPQTQGHDTLPQEVRGNNSVRTKGVNWITNGQQTNVVIVRSTDLTAEMMAGTESTVEARRTLISFRDRQIWDVSSSQLDGVTSYHVAYEKTAKDLDDLGWERHVFRSWYVTCQHKYTYEIVIPPKVE